MKLWILRPIDPDSGRWDPWFDKCFGVIVRAESEPEARQLATQAAGDEEKDAWLADKHTSCNELLSGGEAEVVMSDFHSA